jgi:serine/threonine protein phosphatase PrpC
MSGSLPFTFVAVVSRRGRAHAEIEDRFALFDAGDVTAREARRGVLFAVADGVSSVAHSGDAAETACEALGTFFTSSRPPSEDLLLDILEAADAEIRLVSSGACTIAGLWLAGGQVRAFSLGDSVAYRWRDGALTPLTPDESASQGLSTYLGMGENVRPCVFLQRYPLTVGDVFLLMTDGLLEVLDIGALADRYQQTGCALDMAHLVEKSLDAGPHRDDATLMVIEVLALEASEDDLGTVQEAL